MTEIKKSENPLNLFKYSPKELSLDAFLNYFILWSAKSNNLGAVKKLLLKDKDFNEEISNIDVKLQAPFGKKRADVVVDFKLNGKDKHVVFEDKTHSTTSLQQLESYQTTNDKAQTTDDKAQTTDDKAQTTDDKAQTTDDKAYRYIYLKLGYINSYEKALCRKTHYDLIDSSKFLEIIESVSKPDLIISQFKEYLKKDYIRDQNAIEKAFNDNEGVNEQLGKQDAQLFILDKLGEKFGKFELDKSKLDPSSNYYVKYDTNRGGTPWSELFFIGCSETHPEALFWRIDKRSGRYYIRLNQYSDSNCPNYSTTKKNKTERLKELREKAEQYFNKNSDFKVELGKLYNKGDYEREILIFFLDKNDIKTLLDVIPKFSKDIAEKYRKIMGRY